MGTVRAAFADGPAKARRLWRRIANDARGRRLFVRIGKRRLELVFRDRAELLPVGGLLLGDAKIAKRGRTPRIGRIGRPIFWRSPCLGLLHLGEQLSGLALGTQADFAGPALGNQPTLRDLGVTKKQSFDWLTISRVS